jgi:hypothetical protein
MVACEMRLDEYLRNPQLPEDTPVDALREFIQKTRPWHNSIHALTHFGQLGDLALCRWLIATFQISAKDARLRYYAPFEHAVRHGNVDMCRMLVKELGMTREEVLYCHGRAFREAALHNHINVCTWLLNEYEITKQVILVEDDGKVSDRGGLMGNVDTRAWLATTFGLTRDDILEKDLFRRIGCCLSCPRSFLWFICHYDVSYEELVAHVHPFLIVSVSDQIEANDPELLQEVKDDNVRHCKKGSWVIRKLAKGFGRSRAFWMSQTHVNA